MLVHHVHYLESFCRVKTLRSSCSILIVVTGAFNTPKEQLVSHRLQSFHSTIRAYKSTRSTTFRASKMSWMDSWSRPSKHQATPAPYYLLPGGESTPYCRSCGRVIGAWHVQSVYFRADDIYNQGLERLMQARMRHPPNTVRVDAEAASQGLLTGVSRMPSQRSCPAKNSPFERKQKMRNRVAMTKSSTQKRIMTTRSNRRRGSKREETTRECLCHVQRWKV